MFPGFQLARYRFELILTEDLVLPPYKGFAFRGTMGHVLHELTCTIPGEECGLCPFRYSCCYGYMFETVPDGTVQDARKYSNYPRPYVIKPPSGDKRSFRRYDRLSFEMVLAGRAHECLPHVVATFDEIGRRGMRGETGRYLIDRVTAYAVDGSSVDVWKSGFFTGQHCLITWEELSRPDVECSTIRLFFDTPLLIENKGTPLTAAPSFANLITTLQHRASLLYDLHGLGRAEPSCLANAATDVTIMSNDMQWHDLERITNRQQKRLKTGGLLGSVTYAGKLDRFMPLLRLGELINAGKSTTFGFGGYRLTTV